MADQAAKRAEKLASALLNEYLDGRLTGAVSNKEEYLERCPEDEKDALWEAMHGVDYYVDYFHASHVRPEAVDGLIARLEAVKRKKLWIAEAGTRASRIEEMKTRGSRTEEMEGGAFLASVAQQMNIDTSRLVLQQSEQKLPAYSLPAHPPRMFHRNEAGPSFPRTGAGPTKMERFAQERSLATKAQEVLTEFDLNAAPVDLDELARCLFLHVQEVSMTSSEGCLITDGEIGTVLINRNIASHRRRRFTLAHEIAHYILHKNRPVFEDDRANLKFSVTSRTEIEANIFAAMLLMPPMLMPPRLSADRPTLSLADALMARFDVSLVAALRRLVGESSWRCALVVSQGETIRWSLPSPWFNGYIPSGIKPHPHTIARSLLEQEYEDENGTVMPAEVWVQGSLVEEEAKLREESRRMKNGTVYSLLTVVDPD